MALTTIKNLVRPEVPGCPEPLLHDFTIQSARDFSMATGVIRDSVTFTSIVDQADYVLMGFSAHNEPYYIYSVRREDEILSPLAEAPVLRVERKGTAYYYSYNGSILTLHPTPQEAQAYAVECVVRPERTATDLDPRFEEFADTLAHCVKYKLMSMAGQAWSNPSDAVYNRARYETLKNDARWIDKRARTTAALHVRQRPFA